MIILIQLSIYLSREWILTMNNRFNIGNERVVLKLLHFVSIAATVVSVLMYVSYIPQIYDNLHGQPGNPIQPLVAAINCIFWVIHGLFGLDGHSRDLAIVYANVPGIAFGLLAFLTAL